MSELAASAANSTNLTSQSNGNGAAADTYIFVPVSVRMAGQKMQLDFKVDSKTLAAAEQLRMAVVRGGVVENNKNSTSSSSSSASYNNLNNNNINCSTTVSMMNGCPPSTSTSIAFGQMSSGVAAVGQQSGTVSDRTKSALRKIVGPNNGRQSSTSSVHMNQFQTGVYSNSSYVDSYSAPSTPKSEEIIFDHNDIKSSTSKVKNARTLLAEKLRRSKQTTATNVNGKKTPSKRNAAISSTSSVPSMSMTKKFKNDIHSTPSSPLDVRLNKFTYQQKQQQTQCFVDTATILPTSTTSSGFVTNGYSSEMNNYYPFQQQVFNENYVGDERISSTDIVDTITNGMNGHDDEAYDDVFTLTSMQLLNGNGGVADYQTQESVYIQQLTNADGQTPSSLLPVVNVVNSSDYLADDRPKPTSTTRDTVESVCNAVLASCRQRTADLETFRASIEQNSNVISPHQNSSSSSMVMVDGERLQAVAVGGVDVNHHIVPEHQHGGHHKTSKSKSAPSAMCGFLNPDENKHCRQRCINGFKFCIRHILNDADAPYHPCAYVKTQGSKEIKCNNAVPHKQNTKFCGTHLIMMGMREPKTRKKKKITSTDDGLVNKNLPRTIPPNVHHHDDYYQADAQVYNTSTTSNAPSSTVNNSTTANTNNINYNNNSINHAFVSSTTSTTAASSANGRSAMMDAEDAHQFYSSIDSQVNNDAAHDSYEMNNYSARSFSTATNFGQNINAGQRSNSTCSSSATNNNANNCFDFVSRPDSQLSGVSPYLNGYSSLHSPQSPWKMPTTPNGAANAYVSQNGHSANNSNAVCSSDIARNHPELLSKLSTQQHNNGSVAASSNAIATSTAGQGLRAFANVVTSAMFDDSNSGYGGGGPFQHQRQHYSYSNPNGNPLMLGDDPFLGPPMQQMMMMHNENNSTLNSSSSGSGGPMVVNNGMVVMPSPVPSDLSVESVGSHVSSTFQPTYQLSSTVPRPSPPMSGYQTPSPSVVGGNFGGMHLYGGLPSTSFFGSLVGSPSSSSSNHGVSTSLAAAAGVHLVAGSQTPSSSSSAGVAVKNEPAHLPYHLQENHQAKSNSNKYFSPDSGVKQDAQVVRQMSSNAATNIPNETAKLSHSSKHGVVQQGAPMTTTKPIGTATGKPKKVIRLKPKKRRVKMMGKYRQIPAVSQMCRVIEDLQFDKTDLFPLGLEPSSSDSESDDEASFFLPFVQTLHRVSMDIDDQAVIPKTHPLTSNVVSAARRQLYMLKRSLSLSSKDLRKKNLETKFVGLASRCYPNGVGNALSDLHSCSAAKSKEKSRERAKKLKIADVVPTTLTRKCLHQLSSGDLQVKCGNDALPYANTCLSHILHNVDQKLFRYCTTEASLGCKMPSLDVGISEMPKCLAHQDRAVYRALGNVKLEPEDHINNTKKKVYKTRYIVKKHRPRRKTKTLPTTFENVVADEHNDAQDANAVTDMTDDDEESEKEEDSNQEAQAALASVARDFGFGAHDLSDILVRLPDATLIENILGQELSRSTATSKEEMDSIDLALTATAGDHNWADVEQFLMEENYKSATSPPIDEYQVVTAAVNSSLHVLNGATTSTNFSWPPQQLPANHLQGHQRSINGVVVSSTATIDGSSTATVTKLLPLRVLPLIESTSASSVVNGTELVSYSNTQQYGKSHQLSSTTLSGGVDDGFIRLQSQASRLGAAVPAHSDTRTATATAASSSSSTIQRW